MKSSPENEHGQILLFSVFHGKIQKALIVVDLILQGVFRLWDSRNARLL